MQLLQTHIHIIHFMWYTEYRTQHIPDTHTLGYFSKLIPSKAYGYVFVSDKGKCGKKERDKVIRKSKKYIHLFVCYGVG